MKIGVWIAVTFVAAASPPTCDSESGDEAACAATSLLQLKARAAEHEGAPAASAGKKKSSLAYLHTKQPAWETACKDKAADETCTFTIKSRKFGKKSYTGKCVKGHKGLVCRKPRKPHPAVVACSNKTANETCDAKYTIKYGQKTVEKEITGVCSKKSERSPLACHGTPKPHPGLEACKEKAAADVCSFTKNGKSYAGKCAKPYRGTGLVCRQPRKPRPAMAACSNKTATAACSYAMKIRGGTEKTVTGKCVKMSGTKGALVCHERKRR